MLMPHRPVPTLLVSTLPYGAVQTMPFARPHFDELRAAIEFALTKYCPARGEHAGSV